MPKKFQFAFLFVTIAVSAITGYLLFLLWFPEISLRILEIFEMNMRKQNFKFWQTILFIAYWIIFHRLGTFIVSKLFFYHINKRNRQYARDQHNFFIVGNILPFFTWKIRRGEYIITITPRKDLFHNIRVLRKRRIGFKMVALSECLIINGYDVDYFNSLLNAHVTPYKIKYCVPDQNIYFVPNKKDKV